PRTGPAILADGLAEPWQAVTLSKQVLTIINERLPLHGLQLRPYASGRGFSSPRWVPHAKKKPVLAYELFLKYGDSAGLRQWSTRPRRSTLRSG
ncbi:hypothetical protein FK513_31460, partial [Klebsiella pneumoniae]|uniref:hypothetical protein n=1 Tax=Klebsiella pneumoniae TaxID=573 RepID=UPI00210AB8F8